MLKELRKILKKYSNSDEKDDRLLKELDLIKDDIDYLYNLVEPKPIDFISLDNIDYGVTMKISEEIFEEIMEYIENKNHLFIGIA